MKRKGGLGSFVHPMILPAMLAVLCLASGSICGQKEAKPPVILVIIDTLPAGHSSAYGYERSTTGSLERLAADGVRYEHAVAASPWTLPSIASIFTGVIPSSHQAGMHLDPWTMDDRRLTRMRPSAITLAELFSEHGYKTAGFFNNPFVHPEFGLDKGFETYDYVGGDNLNIRKADQVVKDAEAWIEKTGEGPFFMVLHFFDPHLAYGPPLVFAGPYIAGYNGSLQAPFNPDLSAIRSGAVELSDEDKQFAAGLYDGEAAFTDGELGRFIAFLKDKGIYERALIIVTADHGEEFWEHGGFEHGHSLHREVLEVPLIFKYPGADNAGKVGSGYVSTMDIFPTVGEFLGWSLPFSLNGVSLYPRGGKTAVRPHIIVSENLHYGPQQQSYYADNFKLIVTNDTGKIIVYDVSRDPGETIDVFGLAPLPESIKNQVEHMARDIDNLIKGGKPQVADIDQDTLKKLQSLGYISK